MQKVLTVIFYYGVIFFVWVKM